MCEIQGHCISNLRSEQLIRTTCKIINFCRENDELSGPMRTGSFLIDLKAKADMAL
jgi:hypothetical protein